MNDELSTQLGSSIEQLNAQLGHSQRMNDELVPNSESPKG